MSATLLEELKARDDIFVYPKDISAILESDPQDIRGQARERPDLLGFPVTVIGNRVKIPRLPFIQYCEELPTVIIAKREGPK